MATCKGGSNRGHRVRSMHRLPCAALQRQLKGRYFAEFSSASAIVSKAIRAEGYAARDWNAKYGDRLDITKESVLRIVRQEITQGKILAAFIAPPNASWNSLNVSVCRPQDNLWGDNCQCSTAAESAVRNGNAAIRAAISVINLLELHHIPWLFELPRNSRVWLLQEILDLLKRPHIALHHLDLCQYSTRWKKSTTIMSSRIDACNAQRLEKCCRKDSAGRCSHSKRKHLSLSGSHPSGIPWTTLASGDSKELSRDIAFCLIDEVRSSLMS